MHQKVYSATLLSLGMMAAGFALGTEPAKISGTLPPLPGKAPVFARITKVDSEKGTFDFLLLFDESPLEGQDSGEGESRTSARDDYSRNAGMANEFADG